jgi:hypothetical protein
MAHHLVAAHHFTETMCAEEHAEGCAKPCHPFSCWQDHSIGRGVEGAAAGSRTCCCKACCRFPSFNAERLELFTLVPLLLVVAGKLTCLGGTWRRGSQVCSSNWVATKLWGLVWRDRLNAAWTANVLPLSQMVGVGFTTDGFTSDALDKFMGFCASASPPQL